MSSSSLRLQTLALLGQQFLAQALVNGGSLNEVVADTLLKPQTASGRQKSAAALTGRIRGDAGMLRQAGGNAAEASLMAGMVKDATFSLGENLNKMLTIVQSVANGETTAAEAKSAYDSLAGTVAATIGNTAYNGISLLDGTNWKNDERLTVEASGTAASLNIQLGNSGSAFNLRDLSHLTSFSAAADLTPAELDATKAVLSLGITTVNTLSSGYGAMAESYASEAKHLKYQADNLALAAARAQFPAAGDDAPPGEEAVNALLLDILLRDQGKLVDTTS